MLFYKDDIVKFHNPDKKYSWYDINIRRKKQYSYILYSFNDDGSTFNYYEPKKDDIFRVVEYNANFFGIGLVPIYPNCIPQPLNQYSLCFKTYNAFIKLNENEVNGLNRHIRNIKINKINNYNDCI